MSGDPKTEASHGPNNVAADGVLRHFASSHVRTIVRLHGAAGPGSFART